MKDIKPPYYYKIELPFPDYTITMYGKIDVNEISKVSVALMLPPHQPQTIYAIDGMKKNGCFDILYKDHPELFAEDLRSTKQEYEQQLAIASAANNQGKYNA